LPPPPPAAGDVRCWIGLSDSQTVIAGVTIDVYAELGRCIGRDLKWG
jgi:hypothetical protein